MTVFFLVLLVLPSPLLCTISYGHGKKQISSALWGVDGTEMAHIGVFAHEMGHFFGLPDLYDTDSEGIGYGSGLGAYCLMSNSWGFDNSQQYIPLMRYYFVCLSLFPKQQKTL